MSSQAADILLDGLNEHSDGQLGSLGAEKGKGLSHGDLPSVQRRPTEKTFISFVSSGSVEEGFLSLTVSSLNLETE